MIRVTLSVTDGRRLLEITVLPWLRVPEVLHLNALDSLNRILWQLCDWTVCHGRFHGKRLGKRNVTSPCGSIQIKLTAGMIYVHA